MSGKREADRGNSLLLTNKDRANGFSIVADDRHNTTLLKRGKSVAWFSAAVTEETVRVFVELVKASEGSAKGEQCKRNQN